MNDSDLKVIWYHPPTDTIFQWGHLEAMFCHLKNPGQGHIAGFEFNSWSDFEIVGLV